MTLEEEYTELLEKNREKHIIPFLQKLQPEERRALAPTIKRLAKDYFAFHQEGTTWRSKVTEPQRKMLNYSFFACYSQKEIEKENPAWLLSRDHLEQFLSWYCPSWLSDYINSFRERDWLPYQLSYEYLVELMERGFVQPHPQLIARMLPAAVFEQRERKHYFLPGKLEKFPVTLREHIWYLFHYESTVHAANRWLHGLNEKETGWEAVFVKYVAEGKLDRRRVLKEALLAANRNFNKNLSGWFADLFYSLAPSKAEILLLQPELFNLFSSPHSKVVSAALQGCKAMLDDALFDIVTFLDNVPVLLASDTKAVVTGALQVLEKLAKRDAMKRELICELTTGTFIHRDEPLQSRAAKLLQKFAREDDEDLKQTLSLYQKDLFAAPKALLAPFLTGETTAAEEEDLLPAGQRRTRELNEERAIAPVGDVDELAFFAAQAFDNNEAWHIDVLAAALLRLQNDVKGEDLVKLEPAIQHALKFYFGDWRSSQGALDQLAACLFLDFCLDRMALYPEQTRSARALFQSFLYKSEANKKVWDEHGTALTFLGGWKAQGEQPIYEPYKNLFMTVRDRFKKGQTLPLLSTPTHRPFWIDPAVLVERLAHYQQENAAPDPTDLEIALSRCWLHGTEKAVQDAKEKLWGETKDLLLFLLADRPPVGPFHLAAAWMTAALTKSPGKVYPELAELPYSQKPREVYTGQYAWQTAIEAYETTQYNWKDGQPINTKVTLYRKALRLNLSTQKPKPAGPGGFKKWMAKLTGKEEQPIAEPSPLLFDYLRLKGQWLSTEDRDIRRIFHLAPSHPEPLLALTIDKCLWESTFTGETEKRFVLEVLQALHDTDLPPGEMAHLFLATCLTTSNKTAATYAAEIWIRAVEEGRINSSLIGTILGQQQRIEFAPMKRLTDLLMGSLLGVSARHNRELKDMLTAMLKELPAAPVRGLKKALEIFVELQRLNPSAIHDTVLQEKLQQWKELATLGKVLKAVG